MTAGTAHGEDGPKTDTFLRRARSADVVISVVLLAVFTAVFIGAQEWPFRTRLFPLLVAGGGIAMCVLNILVALFRRTTTTAGSGHKVAGVELKDEDEEEDEALEYVFDSASRSDWARVLAWVAGFFVLLYLVGALFTVPAFALVYLLLEARTTVLVSVVYAALLAALLYSGRELLQMSLPSGALLGG